MGVLEFRIQWLFALGYLVLYTPCAATNDPSQERFAGELYQVPASELRLMPRLCEHKMNDAVSRHCGKSCRALDFQALQT